MAEPLVLMVCAHFRRELDAVLADQRLTDVEVAAFPARCGRPCMTADDLNAALASAGKRPGRVAVIGGVCISRLAEKASRPDHWRMYPLAQCFDLLLNPPLVAAAIAEGGYLLSPGWLEGWGRHLQDMGFDPQALRSFFAESTRTLVLLDSGIDPESLPRLKALSTYLQLPCKVLPVGLDHMAARIARIILEWRLDTERRQCGHRVADANRRISDYAMVFELVAGLTSVQSEEEAIRQIRELFTMLFAPRGMDYIPVPDETFRSSTDLEITSRISETPADPSLDFPGSYAVNRAGDGFSLRIAHRGRTLGMLRVEGFAFPEYAPHYLNLAVTIAQVCGLAVANARAFEHIRWSEEKYRELVDGTEDLVTRTDASGRIRFINKAVGRILGVSQDACIGQRLLDFVCPEDRDAMESALSRAWNTRDRNLIVEGRVIQRASGQRFHLQWSLNFHYDDAGRMTGMNGIAQNITHRKTLAEMAVKAHRQETAGIFASGISHDFNNMLTIILGNLEMLIDDLPPDEDLALFARDALDAAIQARNLTARFLIVSKAFRSDRQHGDICALVREFFETCEAFPRVTCVLDIPESLAPVSFDSALMRNALENIMKNAIESMPDGGAVFVSVAETEVGEGAEAKPDIPASPGRYIRITVTDQGVGIPPDHLCKIFDPYCSTKQMGVQKGMGLGLATTHSIVTKHSGHITVASREGEGTTVSLYLPVAI